MNSKSEKPDVSLSETGTTSSLPVANNIICHVCNVMCNSQRMFDDHINGKKHQIKFKLQNVSY